MAFTIIVDGNNFINDLNRNGKDKDYILNKLSFPHLHVAIQRRLKAEGLYSHPFIRTEFICSKRGQIGEFKNNGERDTLINKFKNEKGVTVREVEQHTKEKCDKGVDFTVFIRMLTYGTSPMNHIVLIASDTDYVPAMKLLAERGTHVIIVGFRKGKPPLNEQLINESYLSLELAELLEAMEKMQETESTQPV